MACNIQTRNLGPRNIILGKPINQTFCIFTKADVASSLQNTFFVVHEPVTQAAHYFWFNVGAAGVDPTPDIPGATGHAVAISANATASAVATALNGVINPLAWVSSTVTANEVECTMSAPGYAYEVRDALGAADKTEFTFVVKQFGAVQVDLGGTEGDITLTLEEQLVPVTAPQYGAFVLEEIRRGASLTASFSLQSTSEADIRRVMNFYGGTIVTENGSGKALTGYGSQNLFKATSDVTQQVIFRPSQLAGIPDASQDFTIPKAKLKLGELTFSGENLFVLPVEVTAYLDTADNGYVNFFSYGDKSAL